LSRNVLKIARKMLPRGRFRGTNKKEKHSRRGDLFFWNAKYDEVSTQVTGRIPGLSSFERVRQRIFPFEKNRKHSLTDNGTDPLPERRFFNMQKKSRQEGAP